MSDPNTDRPYWRTLILVTGHPRSGTSWLAAVIGKAEETAYMRYEPLMVRRHPPSPFGDKILAWRRSNRWFFEWKNGDPSKDEIVAAILGHLKWLCQYYFGGPVDALTIKDPHANYSEFLIHALQPDRVVTIRRHPLGVVNSYDKGNLYYLWDVKGEWKRFIKDLATVMPNLSEVASTARSPAEQVAFMAHVSYELLDHTMANTPHASTQYETLCLEPEKQFSELYHWLGWRWDQSVWSKIVPLVFPEEVSSSFQSLEKYSAERAYAWRGELAPHLVRRVQTLFERLGFDYPFPGSDLPALTPTEISSARQTYFQRRKGYLRQWGIRGFINYR
jgi:hypothetical protein